MISLVLTPIKAANSQTCKYLPAETHHTAEVVVSVGTKPSTARDMYGGFCEVSPNNKVSVNGLARGNNAMAFKITRERGSCGVSSPFMSRS